jgi:DNA-binding NarL/FixJ family response regulator
MNDYSIFLSTAEGSLASLTALGASALFILGRRRSAALSGEIAAESETRSESIASLKEQISRLQKRLQDVENRKTSLWDWNPEPTSINLNRRGQVLRLFRRGDSAAQIASTLGLSKGEVMLIVKVHEMKREQPDVEDFSDSL